MNKVALTAALSVPILGKLTHQDELNVKANLTTLLTAKGVSGTGVTGESVEYIHHGFNGAMDVTAVYDASANSMKVGVSAHKILNVKQIDFAISKGLAGHTASENSTLVIVIPTKAGDFNINFSDKNPVTGAPTGSAGVSWKMSW